MLDCAYTIYASKNYQIDYFPCRGTATAVAITFSERRNTHLHGFGFGSGFMLGEQCALISVKGNVDDWYQNFPQDALDGMRQFLEQDEIRALPRTTYGSSMGAYAALLFSAPLGADACLAISPLADVSADWETRWNEDGMTSFKTFGPESFLPNTRLVVAFDPLDRDARHVNLIRAAAGRTIEEIHVMRACHPVGPALSQAGVLKPLALAVFHGRELPDVAPTLRASRKKYVHHVFILAMECRKRRKMRWAGALFARALESNPLDPEYNIQASVMAERSNRREEALRYAALAVAIKPGHVSGLAHLSDLLDRYGYSASALVWLDRAISLLPTLEALHERRARLLAK